MSKGGTRTVNTTTNVPAFAEPFFKRGLDEALNVFETPTEFFPASTVVAQSPETQLALSAQRERALAGSPLTQQAQDYTSSVLSGDFLGPNPFFNAVFDPAARAVEDRVLSQMSRAGRLGSGAETDILSRNLADLAGNIAFNQYGAERARQQQAAAQAPAMADLDFADLSRLGQVGAAREAQQAAELQDQIRRFEFQQQIPSQKLADYLSAIKGGTFGQTRQEVPKTPISDLIFGGLGGANLGQRLFPGSSIAPVLGGLAGGLGGLF